ncbi:UDP-N-acetylmuramoyl-L-alanyl-D-glutamate--2,6-diaminopimelate ligase [Candidatus Falkowbacteria bacterium]|nr:UDP-N-acetylmuramoyl-L-alanyl-D-glutamate--2,6-diaminopimelate ligase [Candidatus Falkowbacteria bacterium]
MKQFLKSLIPHSWMNVYHYTLSVVAKIWYRNPSSKMIVIGVTGTNGKSSTVNFIGRMLASAGKKVGFASTVNFYINGKETINDKKMTMLGRFALQKFLAQCRDAGCEYVVIETSSQGIVQYRHAGINYDIVVFTNLTPEHIESHGGFENYKHAKGQLFKHLMQQPHKRIKGVEVQKIIVANCDDEHSSYFLSFDADKKIGFTLTHAHSPAVDVMYQASNPIATTHNVAFDFEGTRFEANVLGMFNIYNLCASLSVGFALGLSLDALKRACLRVSGVPGRMELINEGQDFVVVVDYAPEPASLEAAYAALRVFGKNRIIHVLGSCGGGRDVARRPILGAMAASYADVVIVTNEDPYDDDPVEIMLQVSQGAQEKGKREGQDLFLIHDRKEAIQKAISLATTGDIVLITGKGCEVFIASKNNTKIPHDDREVAREALHTL